MTLTRSARHSADVRVLRMTTCRLAATDPASGPKMFFTKVPEGNQTVSRTAELSGHVLVR
jgi:hypothetical protein